MYAALKLGHTTHAPALDHRYEQADYLLIFQVLRRPDAVRICLQTPAKLTSR